MCLPTIFIDQRRRGSLECGYTKRMGRDVDISEAPNARMQCADKECHCHGRVCLVSEYGKGNCSAGNLFVNGRAFCGNTFSLEFGRTVCKELGFQDIVRVTDRNNINEYVFENNQKLRNL